MGGAEDAGAEAEGQSDRIRLQAATSRIETSGSKVSRARELVAEMEDTGGEIINQLEDNREKIESAHGKVKQASSNLDKANTLASRMSKWWNRW